MMDEYFEKKEEAREEEAVYKGKGLDQEQPEGVGDDFLASESHIGKLARQIVLEAIDKKASDVFVEPLEDSLRVRYRIDGLLSEAGSFPVEHSFAIASYLKVLGGLDIAEHRFPQDGRFRINVRGKAVDFRISVLPANLGENVVLRVLDKSLIKLDLDSLGFNKESVQILKRNLAKPYGMILACGPTGCGKTTTLYAGLKFIDSPEVNIVTVEDPVEFQLGGINQVAVKENIGLTFASVLRSILRQDPDIIMVGEIRDFETADIAVKASLTGHLVLSTLHTTTATGAIIRFINMGIEPFLVASSCLAAASQSLLRILCRHCKRQTNPSEALLKELKDTDIAVPEDFKYYKPSGCRFCNNTGFSGRLGIIEIMELDSEIRDLLIRKETELKIRQAAVKKGMKTLREEALRKVVEGQTIIEEVYRVTIES